MKVLFMGTPEFSCECLESLIKYYNVVGVVTQPDKPKGRGHKLMAPPVKEIAASRGIKVYQPETLKDGSFRQVLDELKPDVMVVVAYGQILPKYVLDYPEYGCINVHASLLPKYRGAGPIQWCIINGEKETGVTTMHMAEGIDTGDMILKKSIKIGDDETAGELHNRLSVLGAEVLTETLNLIEIGSAPREVQNDGESSYAPMISRETGKIDFSRGAREINCLIRGLNPWPLAYGIYKGEPVKIISARVGETVNEAAGKIVGVRDGALQVSCGDGSILIDILQFKGSKRMSVREYLNGHEIDMKEILR